MKNQLSKTHGIAAAFALAALLLLLGLIYKNFAISLLGLASILAGVAYCYTRFDKDIVIFLLVCSILLLTGFYHRPVTDGLLSKSIYWIQSIFVVILVVLGMLRSRRKPDRLFIAVLLPLAILFVFAGVYALINGAALQYINGFRKIFLAPILLFLGYQLSIEKPADRFEGFLLLVLGLQIPLSLITNYLYTGFWFEVPQPDYLSGSFGRGGSSSIAILSAVVPAIALWLYRAGGENRYRLILSLIFSLTLIALADIKFTWFLLPLILVFAAILPASQKLDPKKKLLAPLLIGVSTILIVLTATFSVNNYSKMIKQSQETDHPLSVLSPEFLEKYFHVSTGGVRFNDALERPVANRYGSILISLDYATSSWQGALLGFGLDSTSSESILGPSFIEKEIGFSGIGSQTVSRLLLETGWPGLLLFSISVLTILYKANADIRSELLDRERITFAGVILIYGAAMVISFPYGMYGLDLSTAGPFWLLSGMWLHMRKRIA